MKRPAPTHLPAALSSRFFWVPALILFGVVLAGHSPMGVRSLLAEQRLAVADFPPPAEEAGGLGESDWREVRRQEFLREHTDALGRVRPDLWEQGIKRFQQMQIAAGLPAIPGAGAAGGLAGMAWAQIGPAPLRVEADQYFLGPGPLSGEVLDIAIDPRNTTDQVIYIATNNGGIWKSTDGGTIWSPKSDFMPSLSMGAVALDPVNPSVVYAGTGNLFDGGLGFTKGVGIYKSTDAGETWLLLNPGSVFSNVGINRIVLPAPTMLLVATSQGLFRSIDGGLHFGSNAPAFDNGLPILNGFITDLDLDTATSTTVYASVKGTGIFRSTDSGATFPANLFSNPGAPAPPFRFIALAQSTQPDNQRLYASVQGDQAEFGGFAGLFRSTDGGAHWSVLPGAATAGANCQCGYDQTVGVDPQDANRVYIGFQRLWRSDDGGGIFFDVSILRIHVDHHALVFTPGTHISGNPPTRFYVGTDGGIAQTDDGGATWVNLNETIATALFFRIDIGRGSAANNGYTYGVTQDNGTAERRPSMLDLDWRVAIGGDGTAIAVDRCDPKRAFTFVNRSYYLTTTDGGAHWQNKLNSGLPEFKELLAVDPNCQAVYATSWEELLQSTDNGETFASMHTFPDDVGVIATTTSNANTLWLGLKDGTVQRTGTALAGRNSTWTGSTVTGAPSQPVSGLAINPNFPDEVVVVYPGFCGAACAPGKRTRHAFRTTDNGATWADIGGTDGGDPTQNLPDLPLHSVVIDPTTSPQPTIIAGNDAGVLRTTDLGATWQVLGTGLPTVLSKSLAFDSLGSAPLLRVGTYGRSVFELTTVSGPPSACDQATTIPAAGGVFTGATVGSSTLTSTCGGAGPENVFRWTPNGSGTAIIETCGSGTHFDTVLSIRDANCKNGVELACNDDACADGAGVWHASRITTVVTAGQTYFIVVDGWGAASGSFALSVTPPPSVTPLPSVTTPTSTPAPSATPTATAPPNFTPASTATPTASPTGTAAVLAMERTFVGTVFLNLQAEVRRRLRGAQVSLYGSPQPSQLGQLLATSVTAVDGQFMLSLYSDPAQEYRYYFLVLDDPQYSGVGAEAGAGGEVVQSQWISFDRPSAGYRGGNIFYAEKPDPGPPRVPPSQLVPAFNGPFVPLSIDPQDPGGSPLDLYILGIELTQATQCFDQSQGYTACKDNAVQLTAGKTLAVRVYIGHQGGPISQCGSPSAPFLKGVRVGLTWAAYSPCTQEPCGFGFWSGPGAPQYFDVPCSTSISQLREGAWGSATFFIPAAGTAGKDLLMLRATVNGDVPKYKESNYNNNDYPLYFVSLFQRQPLNVRWALIDYKPSKAGNWQYTGNPFADANVVGAASEFMNRVYPMAVNYSQSATVTYTGPDARSDYGSKVNSVLTSAYNAMNPKPDMLVGWLPLDALGGGYKPANQGCGGARVFHSAWVAQCAQPGWMEGILAHETGHTRGLDHPHEGKELCWPFPNDAVIQEATIREIGFDVTANATMAGTNYDLMDQASTYWISPYTWSRLVPVPYSSQWAKVGPGCAAAGSGSAGDDAARTGEAIELAAAEQPALMISGSVHDDGSAELDAFYQVASEGPFPASDPSGPYCLDFRTAGDSTLASHCFDLSFKNVETGEFQESVSFSLILPLPDESARVVLRRGATPLAQRDRSPHAPQVSIAAPTAGSLIDGTTAVSWTATDTDGDALHFAVLYSPDAGASWYPIAFDVEEAQLEVDTTSWAGSDDAVVRVLASDGFNTAAADSPSFQVARKLPRVWIGAPDNNAAIGAYAAIVLTAHAEDIENGEVTGTNVTWQSDRQGTLGTGSQLILPGLSLEPGAHTITVTATDSEGMQGSASITVLVSEPIPCVGDCGGDGAVTVDELLTMVDFALGNSPASGCEAGDANGDGQITVDEILTAVSNALNGCPIGSAAQVNRSNG